MRSANPGDPGKPDGSLNLGAMEVEVDPRAEWQQMYREVWRIERDFFYDPNLHGANSQGADGRVSALR